MFDFTISIKNKNGSPRCERSCKLPSQASFPNNLLRMRVCHRSAFRKINSVSSRFVIVPERNETTIFSTSVMHTISAWSRNVMTWICQHTIASASTFIVLENYHVKCIIPLDTIIYHSKLRHINDRPDMRNILIFFMLLNWHYPLMFNLQIS